MGKKKLQKKVLYIKVQHPTGRVTTQKFKAKSTSLKGVQSEYLASSQHFRNEAYPIKIVLKPKRKKIRRRDILSFRF